MIPHLSTSNDTMNFPLQTIYNFIYLKLLSTPLNVEKQLVER